MYSYMKVRFIAHDEKKEYVINKDSQTFDCFSSKYIVFNT